MCKCSYESNICTLFLFRSTRRCCVYLRIITRRNSLPLQKLRLEHILLKCRSRIKKYKKNNTIILYCMLICCMHSLTYLQLFSHFHNPGYICSSICAVILRASCYAVKVIVKIETRNSYSTPYRSVPRQPHVGPALRGSVALIDAQNRSKQSLACVYL